MTEVLENGEDFEWQESEEGTQRVLICPAGKIGWVPWLFPRQGEGKAGYYV